MASLKETGNIAKCLEEKFPSVDINKELNPGQDRSFVVDPISSKIASSTETKVNTFC